MSHPVVVLSAAVTAALALFAGPAEAALTISTAPTSGVTCSGGVCTTALYAAVLNVGDLETMLASGDVQVAAGKAKAIVVAAPIAWTSASTLSLLARSTLAIDQTISVLGTAGLTMAAINIQSISYAPGASVVFWDNASTLVINHNPYKLVSDIASIGPDASYVALAKSYDAGPDGTYTQAPIAEVFDGVLEGLGNTISNLSIADPSGRDVGLVNYINFNSAIAHLNLVNAHVTGGDNAQVGGLAAISAGSLVNDTVSGTVTCGASISGQLAVAGGLVGGAGSNSPIIGSSSSANVSGGVNSAVGGLVGDNGTVITGSYASGTVTGGGGSNSTAGGLVGANSGGIHVSGATGAVSGARYAGGLAGSGSGSVYQSYATGAVSGGAGATIGGLYGYLGGQAQSGGEIDSSYATGPVTLTGVGIAGGLAGEAHGVEGISQSYSRAPVSGPAGAILGGLAGSNDGPITYSYAAGKITGGVSHKRGGVIGVDNTGGTGPYRYTYWDLGKTGIKDPSHAAGNVANEPDMTGLTDAALRAGLPGGFTAQNWTQHRNRNAGLPYLVGTPLQ